MTEPSSPAALEIDCASVKAMLDSGDRFLLLDCREPDEYELARIKAATLVPMGQIAARIAELEPYRSKRIVVHCHHGGRSLQVASWLRREGFPLAQSMAGGIDAWSVEIDSKVPRY